MQNKAWWEKNVPQFSACPSSSDVSECLSAAAAMIMFWNVPYPEPRMLCSEELSRIWQCVYQRCPQHNEPHCGCNTSSAPGAYAHTHTDWVWVTRLGHTRGSAAPPSGLTAAAAAAEVAGCRLPLHLCARPPGHTHSSIFQNKVSNTSTPADIFLSDLLDEAAGAEQLSHEGDRQELEVTELLAAVSLHVEDQLLHLLLLFCLLFGSSMNSRSLRRRCIPETAEMKMAVPRCCSFYQNGQVSPSFLSSGSCSRNFRVWMSEVSWSPTLN